VARARLGRLQAGLENVGLGETGLASVLRALTDAVLRVENHIPSEYVMWFQAPDALPHVFDAVRKAAPPEQPRPKVKVDSAKWFAPQGYYGSSGQLEGRAPAC
jgi:hypothetical protein